MNLQSISPEHAKRLIDQGAVLIDIRNADEHARERIAEARNRPLDQLTVIDSDTKPVVFHCKSGNRTSVNAARLASSTTCEAYLVAGGLDAWKAAGLPVVQDRSRPIEIQRQVQLAAGGLVLVGVILSQLVAPPFIGLSAFVGAGLMFAGFTGWCGLAKVFAVMPWNRPLSDHPRAHGA